MAAFVILIHRKLKNKLRKIIEKYRKLGRWMNIIWKLEGKEEIADFLKRYLLSIGCRCLFAVISILVFRFYLC
jgi:hypothetical protein